ncbi:hypothetical protein DFQ28_007095, partial [Apophysomyces sp. BC1034]
MPYHFEKRVPTDDPRPQKLSAFVTKLKSTKSNLLSQTSKKKPAVSSSREIEEDEMDEVQLNDEDA